MSDPYKDPFLNPGYYHASELEAAKLQARLQRSNWSPPDAKKTPPKAKEKGFWEALADGMAEAENNKRLAEERAAQEIADKVLREADQRLAAEQAAAARERAEALQRERLEQQAKAEAAERARRAALTPEQRAEEDRLAAERRSAPARIAIGLGAMLGSVSLLAGIVAPTSDFLGIPKLLPIGMIILIGILFSISIFGLYSQPVRLFRKSWKWCAGTSCVGVGLGVAAHFTGNVELPLGVSIGTIILGCAPIGWLQLRMNFGWTVRE